MYAWNYWTRAIADRLSDAIGITIESIEIVIPPDTKMGDFAFGCFRLAKERKMSPAALAQEIATKLKGLETADVAKAEAVGPYVNFTLSTSDVVHRVVRDVEIAQDKYGCCSIGGSKRVLFEYAQPNTHKEIHVGHLRNLLLGVSLIRLLRQSGWQVIPATYHGDVGAHVAKCLWWFVRSRKGVIDLTEADVTSFLSAMKPEQATGGYLGQLYAESGKALDEHPEWKDEVSTVQLKLEAHDAAWEKLWRESRRWSLDEMKTVFDELHVEVIRQYLESEVVDRGQQMVDDLLKKGIAKESQGAKVVDLEDVGLGVFLVRKSDGTSLYATKDLALAELKLDEYPDTDRNIVMVDSRQSFYFKQLFETLKRMGFAATFEFVGYEFVTLKSGAMSSREGNVVTYRSFMDQVIEYARKEVLERHPDWNEGKVLDTAWKLAMAGVKFSFLRQDNDKIFVFDLEQALSFDGCTGPYCQYAITRLNSILKKSGQKVVVSPELSRSFSHPTEKALALKIAQFPSVIEQAGKELRPALVAQWCFSTAQAVNDFYRDIPVLDAESTERDARLRLISVVQSTLIQGLSLLDISVPEEM
jgi:arginyl-tRNA synthetase